MSKERFYDIIRYPHVTEKSTAQTELNKYVFKVAIDSDKSEIKNAIASIFGVKVKSVNTITLKGKVKRFKGTKGRRSDFKKAIVTLEEGQTLDIGTEV